MSLALACVISLLLPQIATASVLVANYMEGSVDGVTAGPQIYAYHQGTTTSFDLEADFDLGTYSDTEVDGSGTNLQLVGPAATTWWDTDWGHRRCFTIDNPSNTPLFEHQVRVVFDSTADVNAGIVQSDGADYRAVAADNTTLLDLWVETGVGTNETVLWVQTDIGAFNMVDFCIYFDNATATTVSSQADVFSYTTQRELYFPTYWRFDGGTGVNGTLDIVSFVDNNVITVDGATQTLNTGQSAVFTGITEDSEILVTGPISGRGRGGGMDSIVPISFAGTEMLFPTNRSNQRWTIISPSGASANVEIYNGTNLQWSGPVGAAAQVIDADLTNNRSGTIRSTNDVPIIVTHAASNNSFSDAVMVPPFFAGDDIYGVRSRNTNIGFETAGSVDILRSDGTFQNVSGGAGSHITIVDGQDRDGNGTAVRFTNMTAVTGGLQQADRDGFESTSYLPERLLENEYYLPSDADYIAFACPTAMNVLVNGVSVPCAPFTAGYPGHGWYGSASAGTQIVSDTGEPFFAYYEDSRNDDETNLFGMKSAQSFAPDPLIQTGGSLEPLPVGPLVGTWTSPVIDASGGSDVFGLLTTSADLPADTDVTVQIARGATPALALVAPFVGPDGTTGTSFAVGDQPIPFDWDFDPSNDFVIVRVTLTTTTSGTTPLVDLVSLGYRLPELSVASSHVVATNGSASDTDYVLRVWSEDVVTLNATSHLFHRSSTFADPNAAATWLIEASPQIVVNAGAVTQTSGPPIPIGPGMPQNVTVQTSAMAGASMKSVWQLTLPGTSTVVPHQIDVQFT